MTLQEIADRSPTNRAWPSGKERAIDERELIFFVGSDANARALQDLVVAAGYDFSIA
jgi:hypothetical protein